MKKPAKKKPKAMTKDEIVSTLCSARGWISCWLPIQGLPEDCTLNGIKAGPLQSAVEYIDRVIEAIRKGNHER
jgi:hypothetical protein